MRAIQNQIQNYIRKSRITNRVGSSALVSLGLLLLLVITPLYNVTGVEDSEAATGTATDSAIYFTSTRNTASVSLTPSSTSGDFASSVSGSTDAAFNIYTTNAQGYELQIKSSTSSTTLKTSSSAADSTGLSTIASSRTSSSFASNTWGYLPNYYNCTPSSCTTNTSTYYPITTSYVTLRKTDSANNSSNRHYYAIGLGAKADFSKTNGTYTLGGNSSTISLYYVANPTYYKITYNKGNTSDTVSNLPSAQSSSVSATSVTLSSTVPTRTGYDFKGWCLGTISTTSNVDSCTGTGAKTFAAGASFGLDRTGTNEPTLYAMWNIKTFTCNRQYRLQKADGTWDSYAADGSTSTTYNGSCSYSKTLADYKASASGTNGGEVSTSVTNVTENKTLSLDFYRNTYSLTVSAGSNTSSPTGSGTYRWGQTATVGVTKAANTTCITYAAPTWTASTGTAPSAGASSTYTMPKSNATVTATSAATNVTFTITFKTSNASAINFNGTSKANNSTGSYTCGNYSISGSYGSGYEFSSWSRTGSGGFTTSSSSTSTSASSSTASTYFRVQGAATITLMGKAKMKYMWNATSADCGQTMLDNRDGTERAYTTEKVGPLCWMTTNLALGTSSVVTLTSDTSNVNGSYNLPASSTIGFSSHTAQNIYNAGFQTCSSSQACYGYYTYAAATAGTNPSSGASNYDICPASWRLPTQAEFSSLVSSYNTGASLVTNWSAVYSGLYSKSSFSSGGSYGYYWSSTAYVSNYAYSLFFGSSSADAGGYSYKGYGFAIRCVAKS